MINQVTLIGNLGADPELRETANGKPVGNLRLATSRKYKNRDEEWVDETEWHRVTLWGKDAENAAKYLAKGRQVYVQGRLHTRKWEDKDGVERYTTEVVCENLKFLAGKGGSIEPTDPNSSPTAKPKEDDIPF